MYERGDPEYRDLVKARTLLEEVAGAVLGNPYLPREVLEREAWRDLDSSRMVLWSRHGIEVDATSLTE